jgi:Transposase IS116/IS110/IS902 family
MRKIRHHAPHPLRGEPPPGSSESAARRARARPVRGRRARVPCRRSAAIPRAKRGGAADRPEKRDVRGECDALTALALVAEIGNFGRFRSAEEFMAFVGLVPSEHSSGEAAAKARSPRSATATCAGSWSSRPGTRAGGRRSATSSPAASAAKTRAWSSAPGVASSASTGAGSGWPAAASRTRRSSSPAPASSPASSGQSPPTSPYALPDQPCLSAPSSGCVQPHGEPSQPLCRTARR